MLSTTGTTGEVEKLFRFAELADIQKPPGECCTAMHGAFVSAFRLDFGLCIS